MLLGTLSPIMPGKDIIYLNWQWDVPLGWVNYFTPLGEVELHSLHQDPVVLLQAGPIETYSSWNGTRAIEKRVEIYWHILLPAHLFMPDRAASPGQHVCYA